jgi:hypothetical protein
MDDLTDAEASGIGRHEQRAVLGGGAEEKTVECRGAQDMGPLRPPGAWWQGEMEGRPPERLDVEKLPAPGDLVTRTPGQVAFNEQRVQGGTDLLRAQLCGGTPVALRETCHGGDRGFLGPGGQALQLHRAEHLEAEGFHRAHRGAFTGLKGGGDGDAYDRHCHRATLRNGCRRPRTDSMPLWAGACPIAQGDTWRERGQKGG